MNPISRMACQMIIFAVLLSVTIDHAGYSVNFIEQHTGLEPNAEMLAMLIPATLLSLIMLALAIVEMSHE